MRFFLEWLVEQRSVVAVGLAVTLLVIALVLQFGLGLWWPWGYAMATFLGLVGLFAGRSN